MYAPPRTPILRMASRTWRYDVSLETTFSDWKKPPGSDSRACSRPNVDSGDVEGTGATRTGAATGAGAGVGTCRGGAWQACAAIVAAALSPISAERMRYRNPIDRESSERTRNLTGGPPRGQPARRDPLISRVNS